MASRMFPYWALPLLSAVIWLAMLLSMFLHWILGGKEVYPFEPEGQTIAYISDVGASDFHPLFIAMGSASVVIFDMGFLAERWLRHKGHLVRNTSTTQKVLSWLAIIFSIVGAAGLILLSIFDTKNHKSLHDLFIAFFIGGYVFCAIFVCAEYQRLGIHFREYRILRISFWMKLVFILLGTALAAAFGVLNRQKKWNEAAIIEWIIALLFTFWVLSFVIDFLPAGSPENHDMNSGDETLEEAAMNQTNGQYLTHNGEMHYPSGTTASGGVTNGWANGHHKEADPRILV